jgi:hypothetical protein
MPIDRLSTLSSCKSPPTSHGNHQKQTIILVHHGLHMVMYREMVGQ